MGDIAEMVLEGVLCEGCGEYLGRGVGYTQRCSSCGNVERKYSDRQQRHKSFACPHCPKRFRNEQGLNDHMRIKHPNGKGQAS